MNNIKTLIKANLLKFFNNSFKTSKTQQNDTRKNITIFVFLCLVLLGSLSPLCYSTLSSAYNAGDINIGVKILFGFASFYIFFLELFQCFDILFKSKDNEMLFALPLKESEILLSRICTVLIISYLYSSYIIIPTVVSYFILSGFNFLKLIFFIYTFILFPLVPIILSMLLNLIFGKIGASQINKNIMKFFIMIIYFAFIIALQYVTPILIQAISGGDQTLVKVLDIVFYREYLISITLKKNFIAPIIYTLISLIIFIIPVLLFGKNYKSICMSYTETKVSKQKVIKYGHKKINVSLLAKDLKRYFSSFSYVFNTIIGPILMAILTITICINKSSILNITTTENISLTNTLIILTTFLFLCGLTNITCNSISMEGKQLWLIKSLPVSAEQIFKSKIVLQLIIVCPIMNICIIICSLILQLIWWQAILLLFICNLYAIFNAILGIVINLNHPILNATNDTAVIKQSFSTFISVIFGFLFPAMLCLGSYFLTTILAEWISLLIVLFFVIIMNIIVYFICKKKSIEKFKNLNQ